MLCCCAVDCLKTAVAAVTVTVNTSVGVEDSGPSTAPLDSTSKIGLETILWLCYMIIYCPCCCVGRELHLVSLFCDRAVAVAEDHCAASIVDVTMPPPFGLVAVLAPSCLLHEVGTRGKFA